MLRVTASLAAAALLCAGWAIAHPDKPRTSQLVYVCSALPCSNGQELEVFDPAGNPIWSVGEYGGDAVFGDCRSDYGPGSVTQPAVVVCYESPANYLADHPGAVQAETCSPPALWIGPRGFYQCQADGSWPDSASVP